MTDTSQKTLSTQSQSQSPYGTWHSPITPQSLTQQTVGFADVAWRGDTPVWCESRPWESGRTVLCADTNGTPHDLTPAPLNIRTRVHEYGGGALTIAPCGTVWLNDSATAQIHTIAPDGTVRPITHTPDESDIRFADFCPDNNGGVYCIMETPPEKNNPKSEPKNELVYVDSTGTITPIHPAHNGDTHNGDTRHDFYTTPTLSPCGQKLAFATWNHPHMPWDNCTVWLAELADNGTIATLSPVAGGGGVSALHPQFSPDGILHYVSDNQGWWQIYAHAPNGEDTCLTPHTAEYGLPHWVFGMRTYGFTDSGVCIATRCHQGQWQIGRVAGGEFTPYDTEFVSFDGMRITGECAVFIGGHPTQPPMVVTLNTTTGAVNIVKKSVETTIAPNHISVAQPITYPSDSGDVYAYYYAPKNADYIAPNGELPPLLVRSHGGPTAQTNPALDLKKIQFWTTRGFAVLDVNYSGSTGYGRAYRDRLLGQWGVLDVADCVAGANYLVEQGLVDPKRLLITGGSAGGYTTLCALTFTDVFRAGCSAYGIGDVMALAHHTHKFESRYLDGLIGTLPEQAQVYRDRSPIQSVNTLNCPVIFLQGADDKVVPPEQAETMANALNAKKIPNAHVVFAGEGHGFRKAENIQTAVESELSFYAQVLGFAVAGDIPPVFINHLK